MKGATQKVTESNLQNRKTDKLIIFNGNNMKCMNDLALKKRTAITQK